MKILFAFYLQSLNSPFTIDKFVFLYIIITIIFTRDFVMTAEKMLHFVKQIGFYVSDKPKAFGLFHICWLVVTVVAILLALKFYNKKLLRISYIVTASVMIVGEIYKQFILSYNQTGAFKYQWYYFPMQFCSTPIYTFTLCAILGKGKLYDWLSVYNGTYCLFAGLTVLAVPSTVYSNYLGICIQSMLHHVLMVIVGAIALKTYAKNLSIRLFLGALGVFLFFFIIAEIINFVIPTLTSQQVNMYFISKGMDLDMPILSHVKKAFPYPIFVSMYALVYTEISIGVAYLFYKIANLKKKY